MTINQTNNPLALFIIAGLLAPTIYPSLVLGDESDTINFIAGASAVSDNNLFRTSSATSSDVVTKAYIGIKFDKSYSLQRFMLDLSVTDSKYQKNDFLNFRAKAYNATWLWALTPRFTGALSADRSEGLNDFRDITNNSLQNIRVTETQNFNADYSFNGKWHLLGGLGRSYQTNSQTFTAQQDFTLKSLSAGLKYAFSSASTFTLMHYEKSGEYINSQLNATSLFDTGFDESENEAKFNWQLTGHSTIDARLSHVSREHKNFSQRDFAGEQASVAYSWVPTGKLNFTTSLSRQLSSFQTLQSNYSQMDALNLGAQYNVSAKVAATASLVTSERTYLGKPTSISTSERIDKERNMSLGLTWKPYRMVTLGSNIKYSTRDSNNNIYDFNDTIGTISLDMTF